MLVIRGSNPNMLGVREPEIYDFCTLADLCSRIQKYGNERDVGVSFCQANHKGGIVDKIQAAHGKAGGIILNPGGYTHTSVAIRDVIATVGIPTVEVHISDPDTREDFRRVSYVRDV